MATPQMIKRMREQQGATDPYYNAADVSPDDLLLMGAPGEQVRQSIAVDRRRQAEEMMAAQNAANRPFVAPVYATAGEGAPEEDPAQIREQRDPCERAGHHEQVAAVPAGEPRP